MSIRTRIATKIFFGFVLGPFSCASGQEFLIKTTESDGQIEIQRSSTQTANSTPALKPPETLTNKETVTPLQNNAAKSYAPYAILSNNVYGKEDKQLPLPEGWKLNDSLTVGNTVNGFYAQTYERREDGKLKEVVMVFRGTEGGKDWTLGNFLNLQQYDASLYAALVLENEEYKKGGTVIEFKSTGHSLGGALAQQVSTATGIQAVVFNTSPLDGIGAIKDGKITRIEERGEVLAILRPNRPDDIQFNFTPGSENDHKIYNLARGMAELAGLPANPVIPATASYSLAPANELGLPPLDMRTANSTPPTSSVLMHNQLTAITQGGSSHIGSAALFTGYGKVDPSVDPNNTSNAKIKTGAELAGYATNTQAFQASAWQVATGTAQDHFTEGNSFGPISAPNGGQITALNNANVQYTHLVKEFQVPVGVKQVTLTINGNFVTNEYPVFVGSEFNDYGVIKLVSPSGTVTEVTAFKEALNSSNFQNVAGLPAPMMASGGQTGFKSSAVTIPVANGGKVIVDVQVHNVGDTEYPSAVLMNNVQLK